MGVGGGREQDIVLKGLWKLVWVELKIFLREPMGSVSTLIIPAIVFLVVGRALRGARSEEFDPSEWVGTSLPIMFTVLIALNAVVSLTTIMSIYREGGILKRLKATPLSPVTILTAHVVVKLVLTAFSVGLLVLVGKTFFAVGIPGSALSFTFAVTISTVSILSFGFVIASIVPTARFAQLIAGTVLYPQLAVCGLFMSTENFSPTLKFLSTISPLTHAVSLTRGMWEGAAWSGFGGELLVLAVTFVVCVSLSSRVFRWE